jgi:NAD(P)-dependent dehydrogenase (short-subunit alcohol dehydrogenase family)
MKPNDNPHTGALVGHVALVTGASRGIGRAIALELARAGAHVIALARTQGALEELDDEIRGLGGEATLVPCDVRDFPALDRLGAAIYERWKKLDIFVGNAGMLGPVTPLAHVDPKQWDDVFAVNVTANWRLIRSLDVLLRASDAGRVVMISSGAGHKEKFAPYWGPYAASKAALDAIVRTYAAETVNVSAVKVMAANPGPLRTRLRAQAMPGEDPAMLRTPEDFAPKVLDMCRPNWTHTGMIYDFPRDRVLAFQAPRDLEE